MQFSPQNSDFYQKIKIRIPSLNSEFLFKLRIWSKNI